MKPTTERLLAYNLQELGLRFCRDGREQATFIQKTNQALHHLWLETATQRLEHVMAIVADVVDRSQDFGEDND